MLPTIGLTSTKSFLHLTSICSPIQGMRDFDNLFCLTIIYKHHDWLKVSSAFQNLAVQGEILVPVSSLKRC